MIDHRSPLSLTLWLFMDAIATLLASLPEFTLKALFSRRLYDRYNDETTMVSTERVFVVAAQRDRAREVPSTKNNATTVATEV